MDYDTREIWVQLKRIADALEKIEELFAAREIAAQKRGER